MNATRIKNCAREYGRAILAWLMIPLMIAQGGAIVGCGCSGHFEAVCHCGNCESATSGQSVEVTSTPNYSAAAHPCCCHRQSNETRQTCLHARRASRSAQFQEHQCRKIVLHTDNIVVAPATHTGNPLLYAAVLPAPLDRPADVAIVTGQHIFAFDSGPPAHDLVIALRRLVI